MEDQEVVAAAAAADLVAGPGAAVAVPVAPEEGEVAALGAREAEVLAVVAAELRGRVVAALAGLEQEVGPVLAAAAARAAAERLVQEAEYLEAAVQRETARQRGAGA